MNKVCLCGRLTRDIELRFNDKGMAFGKTSIAVDRRPKQDGTKETDFINLKMFGKTAETMQKYLNKGRKVLIEGNIQTGSYESENGQKIYTFDVVVNEFEFIDSKHQETNNETNNEKVNNNNNLDSTIDAFEQMGIRVERDMEADLPF